MWSDANSFFIHSFIHFSLLAMQSDSLFFCWPKLFTGKHKYKYKKMQAITNYVAKSTHQVIKPADLRIGDGEREVFKMSLGLDA